MSGVREVIETFHVPLDPTKDFRLALPQRFLQDEPNQQRVIEVWNKDVVPKINNLCRARKSGFINRSLKRSIFQSGMENVCRDFSRKTESICVQFKQSEESDQYHHNRKVITYSLVMTRLTPVSQDVRHARYCVAEIPINPLTQPAVQAEYVATADEQQEMMTPSSLSSIPTAHSEIISTHVPIIEYTADDDDDDEQQQPYVNPPVACAAIVVEQQDEEMLHRISDRDSRRSPLERMQELESIKMFLSQAEYTAKRQAILDDI